MAAQITADELVQMLEGDAPYLLIDIRDADSFAAGHIPGAISIPADGFNLGAIPADTPRDTPVFVVCYRGIMSRQAAPYVAQAGFTDVRSVKGGMAKWRGPIER